MGYTEIAIFPMTPADLDGVMEVEQLSFLTPWSREAFAGELMQTYTIYLVAREGDRVVAHGGMHVIWDEAHITNIAVRPEYRGRGLGEQMMLELLGRATARGVTRVTLEVRVTNTPARRLYEKLGFVTAPGAVRKGYYSDTGEDAIVMWKDWSEEQSIPEAR
ncbi:MAG: ribosomal protein S18-alanine N-acetyltransferase [Mycobacterium leprae]